MIDSRWFNAGTRPLFLWRHYVKVFNLFNRHFAAGSADPPHQWGIGVLQIGHRHLLYVGHAHVYIAFCRVWGDHA